MEDGGKLILLGDPTQSDIRGENAMEWLPKFVARNPELKDHIAVIEATSDDIVRGGLCKKMVKAKERGGIK
jgi:phosphate starvation-inducible PhoH-like protein